MYVSGELAAEPKLAEALGKELGFPVLQPASPLKCPNEFDPTNYLVNIGLTLKELDLGKEAGALVANVNSLPISYQAKPIPVLKLISIPATVVVIGVLVMMAISIYDASTSMASARTQLDNTEQIIEQKQTQRTELTESIATLENRLAEAKASCNTYIEAKNNLDQRGNMLNDDLATTIEKLIADMSLSIITHSNNILTLRGNASSEVEILSYARKLDESGRFSEVTITNINRVGEEGMNFTLTLKTGEQEEE